MSPLNAGDKAPLFSLPDRMVNQSAGRLCRSACAGVFLSQSHDAGLYCPACGLRDNMDELKQFNVEVLGISTDKPEKLSRFAEKSY